MKFAPLVEAVAAGAGPVEITDYGKVIAILISQQHYQWLCSCAERQPQVAGELRGFFVLHDTLDGANQEISAAFEDSLKKTESQL